MKREYTAEEAVSLALEMRKRIEGLTLATDIIVGFPGEREEDFHMSMSLLEEMRPDVVNITRFSPRPGTPAQAYPDRIPGWRVKEWSREMTEKRFAISLENNRRLVGKEERVLAVEDGRDENTTVARTTSYRPVVIRETIRPGVWVDVKITGAEKVYLLGERIEGPG